MLKIFVLFTLLVSLGYGAEDPKAFYQSSDELITLGKRVYKARCISCHGINGDGQEPAGLAVHARNYHAPLKDWTNGTKISSIFKTLSEGSKGKDGKGTAMASYDYLSIKERFALAHFIRASFVSDENKQKDTDGDFAAIAKKFEFFSGEKFYNIDIEDAIKLVAEDFPSLPPITKVIAEVPENMKNGQDIYQRRCISCHGVFGQGKLANLSNIKNQTPENSIRPFSKKSSWFANKNQFIDKVGNGYPGGLKPSNADLSSEEMDQLYSYVKFVMGMWD